MDEVEFQGSCKAGGQIFKVVLTPDLEDGGFTVQCHEKPWAISQGETIQEALDNIIDALELGLEHEREWPCLNLARLRPGAKKDKRSF